ncbi:hypothetical protein Ais01nite_53640 [Asanoa ishikariensis]|uniref:Abortive infection protein n=1 Tax=Asanoa ishikariensis TaxID=137265 RepID=A0A1H3TR54_9ACTN|nr:hypothetical protein [Asanoa ishikariensis]GIF67329.1 hypothetical protein Ais01nite_53640 [Asanoa ishikariensis]SDZ52590.1 hypothetical protein SAMN05421684_6226 [Asanoa ishikariensis]
MRAKGITYDTGFAPGGRSSRPVFDADAVRRELRVIADDLHCAAVRITGGDPERLTVAAEHAVDAGLEVWFSPFPCELPATDLLPYFADCADRAQEVGADVFVAGCELSLFAAGFLPGDDSFARITALTDGAPEALTRLAEMPVQLNAVLADTAATVRERFRGKVTYAAGTWEQIDWAPFDIASVDAYGDASDAFRQGVREYQRHGKPLAATEFGCCTYRGAAERGGMGWAIVDHEADPPRLDGDYTRDEGEQARYLREMITLFDEEGVDTAFWFTFASYGSPHHTDPRFDLDMASYGVCKLMPDGSLAPKQSFHAMAEAYR